MWIVDLSAAHGDELGQDAHRNFLGCHSADIEANWRMHA
jgi:hypothetical protein